MSLPTHLLIADLIESAPLTTLGNIACPFCGGVTLSQITYPKIPTAPEHSFIQCETCWATGPSSARPGADAHWNKRAFGPEIFIRPTDLARIMNIVEAGKAKAKKKP